MYKQTVKAMRRRFEENSRSRMDLKVVKERCQGRQDDHMMADYCWTEENLIKGVLLNELRAKRPGRSAGAGPAECAGGAAAPSAALRAQFRINSQVHQRVVYVWTEKNVYKGKYERDRRPPTRRLKGARLNLIEGNNRGPPPARRRLDNARSSAKDSSNIILNELF
ncbi:hypothetical protein EVAR_94532_1 [Eumeta japonica]|uniref:Uncharacterized protein n=1 Tax=Eumeta variegata TaxID=151549 RepID=A0A4C1UWQ9_EUMVA|nr:hypothetical protein EVAR_94532_1 [Eumeta japonica]